LGDTGAGAAGRFADFGLTESILLTPKFQPVWPRRGVSVGPIFRPTVRHWTRRGRTSAIRGQVARCPSHFLIRRRRDSAD